MKGTFHLVIKIHKDKKKLKYLGKEESNFRKDRNKTYKFEQKSLEIDGFNDAKEQEVNEKIEKRKNKMRNRWEKQITKAEKKVRYRKNWRERSMG